MIPKKDVWHGMGYFNWFCFEIQLHHFEVESLSPTKTHHSWILPHSLKKKCLKYPSFWFIFELFFVSPQKTRWWQLKYFSFSPRNLGKWSILTSIFSSNGWFNHRLEKHFWPTNKNGADSARWLEKTPLKGGTSLGNFWPSWEGSDGIFFFCWDVFCWAAKELGSNNNISDKRK